MSQPRKVRLFVYDTLRTDEAEEGLLAAFPKHSAQVKGKLFKLAGGYPVLVPDPDGRWIQGELVDIHTGVLTVLDLYENVSGGLYRRAAVQARLAQGMVSCLAYVLRADDVRARRAIPLDTDDWRRISGRRRMR